MQKNKTAVFKGVLSQVVLLDINNTAGESFKEALDKEYGQENSLFFKCDVESEEQVKGEAHSQSQVSSHFITGRKFCRWATLNFYTLFPVSRGPKENCGNVWRNRHSLQQCRHFE